MRTKWKVLAAAGVAATVAGAGLASRMERPSRAAPVAARMDDGWFDRAVAEIEKDQMRFRKSAEGVWYNANVRNRVQLTYRPDGFSVLPAHGEGDWRVDWRIVGVGRATPVPFTADALTADGVKAQAEDERVAVRYENLDDGMRQDFVLKAKPEGKGPAAVTLEAKTELEIRAGGDAVSFHDPAGREVVRYAGLKAWDADGRVLPSHVEPRGQGVVALVVDDAGARYPVTVDPMSTTLSQSWTPYTSYALFGLEMCGIGDVNGDGFGDVAVFGDVLGNRTVHVYHGSAAGLPTSSNWTVSNPQSGSGFGACVSSAGDWASADGYADLAVGAPTWDSASTNDCGAVFVYRGSASGLVSTPIVFTENVAGSAYGAAVCCAGDVNDDNGADLLVGAPDWTGEAAGEGRAYLYFGGYPDGNGNYNVAADFTVDPTDTTNAHFGRSVAGLYYLGHTFDLSSNDTYGDIAVAAPGMGGGRVYVWRGYYTGPYGPSVQTIDLAVGQYHALCAAGDANGDGFCDMAVGMPNTTSSGTVRIYNGSGAGVSSTAFTAVTPPSGSDFGWFVSYGGDVNGDGFGDVVVGDPNDGPVAGEGSVRLILGSSSGPSISAWSAHEGQDSAQLGSAVAGAGDVNGDGYSDVLGGAPFWNGSANDVGRGFAYYGGPFDAVSTTSGWQADPSAQAGARYGHACACIGDVNGDGFEDMAISAPKLDIGGVNNVGRVYVYHGAAGGPSTTASLTLDPTGQANAEFGDAVCGAGDVDQNGFADLMVGAPLFDATGANNAGKVWIFGGGLSGLGTSPIFTRTGTAANQNLGDNIAGLGDVDSDGFADIGIENQVHTTNSIFLDTITTLALPVGGSGPVNIEGAGDVNRDGFSGVLMTFIPSGGGHGTLHFLGSAFGLTGTTTPTFPNGFAHNAGDFNNDGFNDVVVVDDVNDTLTLMRGSSGGLTAPGANDSRSLTIVTSGGDEGVEAGYAAGDFNGDGFGDFAVKGNTNQVVVFIGNGGAFNSTTATRTQTLTDPNIQSGNAFGGRMGAGDLDGDGFADVIVGDSLTDVSGTSNVGRGYVFFGGERRGKQALPRQFRNFNSIRITAPLWTHWLTNNQVVLSVQPMHQLPGGTMRLVYRLSRIDTTEVNETNSGTFGTTVPATTTVSVSAQDRSYEWVGCTEFRVPYAKGLLQPRSRWILTPANVRHGRDFRSSH